MQTYDFVALTLILALWPSIGRCETVPWRVPVATEALRLRGDPRVLGGTGVSLGDAGLAEGLAAVVGLVSDIQMLATNQINHKVLVSYIWILMELLTRELITLIGW